MIICKTDLHQPANKIKHRHVLFYQKGLNTFLLSHLLSDIICHFEKPFKCLCE